MTHNLAIGTVVRAHMTVNGVTGVTVGGIVVGNDTASETYFVAVRFALNAKDKLVHSTEVSLDSLTDVATL